MSQPTPYPAINVLLAELLASVQAILGDGFVGMVLDGSLAGGDFDPESSDIDFIVATTEARSDSTLAALTAMHERLAMDFPRWGRELEGAYLPLLALRRYDPANALYPHIERGGGLRVEPQGSDGIIHRHIAREQGIVLAGPAPQTLIDPVSPDELRGAVRGLLDGWWAPMVADPTRLHHPGYRTYAIVTMARMLYTLRHGTIVSKPVAARWAQAALGARWATLVAQARAWREGEPTGDLDETASFIEYTVDQSRQVEMG